MSEVTKFRPISTWILMSCGVWLVGLGLYFIFLRPPLLPEDPRFMGTTLEQLQASVPGLARWLNKVFGVMGGFMASTGVLTVFVASVALPARLPSASSVHSSFPATAISFWVTTETTVLIRATSAPFRVDS